MNTEIKSVEEELLFKIIEQWGNAMCPTSEMINWLKEYASQFKQPDISEDVEKAAVEFKNLAKYSMDDKIGSAHWFRTLMSNVLHIGEYMKGNYPIHEPLQKGWGEKLYNISKDMLEWFGKVEPIPTVDENNLWNEVGAILNNRAVSFTMYPKYINILKSKFLITRK